VLKVDCEGQVRRRGQQPAGVARRVGGLERAEEGRRRGGGGGGGRELAVDERVEVVCGLSREGWGEWRVAWPLHDIAIANIVWCMT